MSGTYFVLSVIVFTSILFQLFEVMQTTFSLYCWAIGEEGMLECVYLYWRQLFRMHNSWSDYKPGFVYILCELLACNLCDGQWLGLLSICHSQPIHTRHAYALYKIKKNPYSNWKCMSVTRLTWLASHFSFRLYRGFNSAWAIFH